MGSLHRRLLEAPLLDRLKRSPAVIVTGARQTGKTTLVRSFDGATRRRYETLDSLTTLDRARHEPDALIAGGRLLTLDEVQRAPDLLIAIKRAIDEDRKPGKFLLTGSANLSLIRSAGESLAGRAAYLVLRGMTEREKRRAKLASVWPILLHAGASGPAVSALPKPVPLAWHAAALSGGFPPAALAADVDDRRLWLDGYVDTYVQRDVRDLTQISDLSAFLRLLKLAAHRTGGLLNQADLARDAGIGRTTAQRWLSVLEASFLVILLEAFSESPSKRLIKAPKLFFCDTGLGLHLCGLRTALELKEHQGVGAWLENLILNDLLAWRETELVKPSILHYRSAGGEEIDFVVEHGRRLLPIEVKARRAVHVRDAAAVDSFCADMGSKAPFGVILYDGSETFLLTKTTLAVPLGCVF